MSHKCRPDMAAIRDRWPEGRLANTGAREDVLTLMRYVVTLEAALSWQERATEIMRDRVLKHLATDGHPASKAVEAWLEEGPWKLDL
jgi:hypothetical protein